MKNIINSINEVATSAASRGISHLYTQNKKYTSNSITLNGMDAVNFGSCSYLGLEFDQRLINGGIQAMQNYGTQFSASRSYVSCGLYADLELRFDKIFNAHCVISPTTTLGHIATIPTLVGSDDAVILDHQVHASVQNAVQLLKPKGVHVEMVRHNRMDILEDRIKFLRTKHKHIWYMADGIYSMFGDKAPLDEIYTLLNKYPEFHFYVDDAHGMSCYGTSGQGYVLDNRQIHHKMIVATSLAKAFATGGAVLVFPTKEMAQKVRNCGGPLITSGPMQPAALGAAIASADIHLSHEITEMQMDLQENIKYTNLLFTKCGLPLVANNDTPIFFVGVGLPKVGYNLVKRVLDEGAYTNIGIFPAVPMKNTGVRFTITRLHTFEQIEQFTEIMAHHYPLALNEEGYTLSEVKTAFGFKSYEEIHHQTVDNLVKKSNLVLEHQDAINKVSKEEWDTVFKGKGSFDWDGIKLLENTFKNNQEVENNWVFDFLTIRDTRTGKPVLKTFTTTALSKDDMLSDANISEHIEIKRKTDPYYLTSKVLSVGSFLTMGEHLYIDYDSEFFEEAIELFLAKLTEIQKRESATSILLRDFFENNIQFDKLVTKNGYFKTELLDNNTIKNPVSGDALLSRVSKNKRSSLKKTVFNHQHKFQSSLVESATEKQIQTWYQLYLNVKSNKSELNTFKLPLKLFKEIANSPNWEIIELRIKPEFNNGVISQPVSVIFNYLSGNNYSLMMIGLDYSYSEFKPYQQTLHTALQRAEELQTEQAFLGFTASFEKQKFGATVQATYTYVQMEDHFNMSVIQSMSNYIK